MRNLDDAMNGDSDREVSIFAEALEVPPQERNGFLEEMCNGDEALIHKIKDLLNAYDRLGSFLEEPPATGPLD